MNTFPKPLLALLITGSTAGGSFAQLSASFTSHTACDRTVTFTNQSIGFSSVFWDFGDAATSAAVNPSHQYASSGNFTVTLTVSNGALTANFSQTITVYDPPSLSINGAISICGGETVTYDVATSGNNYQWTVYGGAITSGQGTPSITVTWATSGTGYVELTETNPLGCSATTRVSVEVHRLPTPFFSTSADSAGTSQDRLSACEGTTKFYSLLPPLSTGSSYLWEITGGDIVGSSTLSNVSVLWTTSGEGKIKITETTAHGCTGTTEIPITILPAPHASFTTADICLGNEAVFTDQSTGNIANWYWDFGDGTSSTYQFPTHLYTSPGTYDVTLIVSASLSFQTPPLYSNLGCSDDTTITITVDQNPGPPIVCPGTVCAGDVETYTTPAVAGASYQWTVTGGTVTSGGGTSDNEVIVQWGSGPVGTITLLVTGAGITCPFPSVTEIPIVSTSPPIYGPAVVCNFSTVIYDAPLLPGATYNWTVTGGTLNSGQGTSSISVYFSTTGTKTITLTVDHDLANCSGQRTLTVQVLNPFSLSAGNYACAGSSATYTVFGTPNPSGYAWNWTVTGGTITSGQGTSSIAVQWGNGTAGEIIVNAPAGTYCNTQERRAITIKPYPPPAPLSGAMNVCATSTVTYFLPAGLYNTWTVTGGTIRSGGTGNNFATIEWGAGPSGQITVVQEDRATWPYCQTTTNFTVDISSNNPIAISGLTTVCSNTTVTYTSSSNSIYPHLWEVTGGTILSGWGTNSITVRWGNGIFGSVSVTEQICNNTEMLTVEIITPAPPIIDTTGGTCDGSSIGLYVVNNIYASCLWSTGGVTSAITVTTPGVYSVTVTDNFGCTASGSISLNAIPRLPVPSAFITGSGPTITPLRVLRLTALPDDHMYLWSTGSNRQSIFVSNAGTYEVTVTNEYGCTAAASVDVTETPTGGLDGGGGSSPGGGAGGGICPLVNPDFTNSICNPIQFTNTTNPPAQAYFWEFGDGQYSWDENPVHHYPSAGNYTVTFWATDNFGVCWSFIQRTVNVPSYIKADFNIAPACHGEPIQFTEATSSALPITGWQWDFGDATTSTQQNPSHLYSAPGTYVVTLTANDGICTDTKQRTVSVQELVAQFSVQEACLGMFTLFTNTSFGSRIIARSDWNFGDATTSTLEHPAHWYAAAGSYNVTLTVTDMAGCTASATQTVDIWQFNAGNITPAGPITFCEGGSIDLTAPAGAGYTYRWSTGETAQTLTVTKTGAYYIIVTEPGGCRDTVGPLTVLVYPKPFAYILPNGPITFCAYSAFTTLSANPSGPGFAYQWVKDGSNAGSSQSQFVYTVSHSGSYVVEVTDNHGCKDLSDPLVVTIHPNPPPPSISASGPTTFCEGGSVTLTALAGYTYQWSNGSTTQSTTIYTTGDHKVTITDANGCHSSNVRNVTVRPLPDMRLVPYGCYDICLSDSSRIYGPAGMTSYVWSTGETTPSIVIHAAGTYSLTAVNSFGCNNTSSNLYISTTNPLGVNLGSDVSFCDGGSVTFDAGAGFNSYEWQDGSTGQTFTASVTGLYHVLVTDTNNCEGRDTISVTVFTNPVVNLNDTLICIATNHILDAGAGAGWTYIWSDNSTNQTLSISASGTYSVTVTDANTCTGSDAATVTFSALGAGVDIGPDVSFCGSGSYIFDAGAGFSFYLWQDGSTSQTFGTSAPGTYSVTVSDAAGCTASDAADFFIYPNPVVDLPDDAVICDIINIILDAGAGFTYLWNDNSANQTLPVSAPGTFSVTVTDANGCTASDNTDISLAASSAPLVASASAASICAGESVQLHATGGTNYNWTPAATLDNPSISNPVATPVAPTTYIVTADDSSGCLKSDSVTISVLPLFTASIDSGAICLGESIQLHVTGGDTYAWSPAAGLSCTNCANPVASPVRTTTYSVTVTASGYCNTSIVLETTVTVFPLPDPGLPPAVTIGYGSSVTFTPNGGMAEYHWTATDGWTCENCPSPSVSPVSTTTYTLTVTDTNGCKAVAQGTVEVLSECEGRFAIPTAFSPNGDGSNDVFRILHQGDLQLISFKVFNRWGEIVFETTDRDKAWNGMYEGKMQELSVFAYYARMTCGGEVKTVVGNVTLIH